MRAILPRFLNAAVLCAALVAPVAIARTAMSAEDQKGPTYHDKLHNDDHEWSNNEDQAYRAWGKDTHHKYKEFSKLKEGDQQAYWTWRHEHSDEQLKARDH
jgi:hypothetical protein